MQFAYEAMTSDGRLVADQADGASSAEVADSLRSKGLTVLRVQAARSGPAIPKLPTGKRMGGARPRDLVLFTQQLKMLLEAGSALVPALEAIERQTARQSFATRVRKIREHVEEGGTLTEAFAEQPNVFKPVFRSVVAAGEATATLPEAFNRLNDLTVRQQRVRKALIAALLYPAILSLLCIAVTGVVLGFVLPRFRQLFSNLNSPLPPVTQAMFTLSERVADYWPVSVILLGGLIVGLVVIVRVGDVRQRVDRLMLRLPVLGQLTSRLILARILRIWAAMLRCHVPLLEAIRQSKSAITTAAFGRLVSSVEEAVTAGGSIGRTLQDSGLVEPVIASAIATGEENGRLTEAVEFVSTWIDEDNTRLVGSLTRIAEPSLLMVMGLFVGLVAMSLFIPLFDLATAGV
jgi:type II secretory pathway component PulF